MNEYKGSGKERRAQIIKTIEADFGADEALIEQLVRGFLSAGAQGRTPRSDIRLAHCRMGAASAAYVFFLVVDHPDEWPLPRSTDARAFALAD